MKLIYIAGSYTAKDPYRVKMNIMKADLLAMDVELLGLEAFPICPHTNTAHHEGTRPGTYFIAGTLELSRRCDAILVVPDSENSVGTKGEIRDATRRGVPVFYNINELREWLTNNAKEE